MTDTTQAVADNADGAAQVQAPEKNSAPDDLDSLLKEFESSSEPKPKATEEQPKQEQPKDGGDKRLDEVYGFIQEEQRRRARDEFTRDFSETVKNVKGDLAVSDTIAKGFIHAMAEQDPRIAKAFVNRASNPETWKKVQGELNKALTREFEGQPDKRLTEDREAVAAAVRNSSNQPPPEQKLDGSALGKMSDAEFRNFERRFRD